MSKPKVLGGKAYQTGDLRRYIREIDHEVESGQAADIIIAGTAASSNSRPAVNYILGGLSDNQYQSKPQQKKLLGAATFKARVNVVHTKSKHEETKPIDGPISFSLVNLNRVIVPTMMHWYSPFVLTVLMCTWY